MEIEWAPVHVCIGGWVYSKNDDDRHYISPHRVAELDHLDRRTCVFFEDREDYARRGGFYHFGRCTEKVMVHVPSTMGHYSPPGRHDND